MVSSNLIACTKAAVNDYVRTAKMLSLNAEISKDSSLKSKFEILTIFQIDLAAEGTSVCFNWQ